MYTKLSSTLLPLSLLKDKNVKADVNFSAQFSGDTAQVGLKG